MSFAISSRGVALAIALALLLLAPAVAAEPVRFLTPVTCEAHPSGNTIDLDPGRYLPEPEWIDLDTSIVGLQNDVTRLQAENKELRKPDPANWKLILAGTLIGVAAGAYAFRK